MKYLDKHLNKTLTDTDHQATLNELDCAAVKAPTLDPEVMEQLKCKITRFGAERNLYNIQEELLGLLSLFGLNYYSLMWNLQRRR